MPRPDPQRPPRRRFRFSLRGLLIVVTVVAALQNLLGGSEALGRCRRPEIMADAAHAILVRDSRQCSGNFFLDDEVLRQAGVTDFDQYAVMPGVELLPDFFV